MRSIPILVIGFLALSLNAAPGPARRPAPVATPATGSPITALAFSPNGRLLAAGSYRRITLIEVGSRRVVRTLNALEGPVTSLAFTANGGVLAAGSGAPGKEGEVSLWSVNSGRRIQVLTTHTDLIYGIALRPDQRQIAAVSYDHLVSLWSLGGAPNPRLAPSSPPFLRDHTDSVYDVSYSPDGRQLATAAGDRTVKVWDTTTGARLFTLSDSTAELYSVAFRPGGTQVAGGGVDRTLRVWNVGPFGGSLARSGFAHDGAILKVVYSHDGKSLFTSGQDDRVKEWDAETLTERANYPRQPDWPQSLAVSPDDKLLAVGRYDGSLALYDIGSRRPVSIIPASLGAGALRSGRRMNSRLTKRDVALRRPSRFARAGGRRAMSGAVSTAGHMTKPDVVLRRRSAFARECAPDEPDNAHNSHPADVELARKPGNETAAAAQPIAVPCIVTGTLWSGKAGTPAPSHYYRFPARKGQKLILDVLARRTGSPLDSEMEILDVVGRPIERAVLRAVGQTEITLFDRDSGGSGMRLILKPEFAMGDYVLVGRELLQIHTLPKGPDDDYQFRNLHGQRTGCLSTTPEYHTIGTPVYKVEIHPPGSSFSPNGMPLTHVFYRNDDGGPLYGRDSCIDFTPPADAEYIVRVSDVRGAQGDKFAYKLRIHAPLPDFEVAASPAAFTVPKEGATMITVEGERREGFEGEIHLHIDGLSSGITATDGVIETGETSALIRLSAAPGTVNPSADSPSTYRMVATASIDGREVTRTVEPDNKTRRVSIGPGSNVSVSTDVRDATIAPGGTAIVEAIISRLNGFKGRVPLDVRNLPYGVKVDDIGLNGVLINEQETSRKFIIRCEPWVKPQSRLIYVTANVENGVANTALPVILKIAGAATAR